MLVCILGDLHDFSVLKLVPQPVRTHEDEIVRVNLKTGDFWLIDDHIGVFLGLLGLVVPESAGGGETAGEDPQRTCDDVAKAIGSFSYCSCLVYFSSSLDYAFLLIRI